MLLLLLLFCGLRMLTAYDYGHHFELTTHVLTQFNSSNIASDMTTLANLFTDYFAVFTKRHSRKKYKVFQKFHFDALANAEQILWYWHQLSENTADLIQKLRQQKHNKQTIVEALVLLGATLHAVQDFYAHSNWVELNPRPHCSCFHFNSVFSHPKDHLLNLDKFFFTGEPLYSSINVSNGKGKSSRWLRGKQGKHGDYCYGVNKDSYVRPFFQEAYMYSFIASMEWVSYFAKLCGSSFFNQIMGFTNVSNAEYQDILQDLHSQKEIAMNVAVPNENGHWKGFGSGNLYLFLKHYIYTEFSSGSIIKSMFSDSTSDNDILSYLSKDLFQFSKSYDIRSISWPPLNYDTTNNLDATVILKTNRVSVSESDDHFPWTRRHDLFAHLNINGQQFEEPIQRSVSRLIPQWTSIVQLRKGTSKISFKYNLLSSRHSSKLAYLDCNLDLQNMVLNKNEPNCSVNVDISKPNFLTFNYYRNDMDEKRKVAIEFQISLHTQCQQENFKIPPSRISTCESMLPKGNWCERSRKSLFLHYSMEVWPICIIIVVSTIFVMRKVLKQFKPKTEKIN